MKVTKRIFCVLMCAAVLAPARAATNGCDNPENDRINSALALCSTHAYNIGSMTNPTTADERQLMRDIVALKTTVITQQMYSQYVYLDAMIRRLKTQLEKAVLTTSLAAAGAATDEGASSSGAYSPQKNMYIAGVTNCNNMSTTAEVYTCLRNNYNQIYNMSSGGNTRTNEARRQLAADYNIACSAFNGTTVPVNCGQDVIANCTNPGKLNTKDSFSTCLDNLNGIIRNGNEAAQRANAQLRGNYNPYGG